MKNKESKLRPDTFGDVNEYKTLTGIVDMMNRMTPGNRRYYGKFITEFGDKLNSVKFLPKTKFSLYVMRLVMNDYLAKLENSTWRMDDADADKNKFFTHLRNFMHAKLDMNTEHRLHGERKKQTWMKIQKDSLDNPLDLPAFQLFGSKSSKDYDVLVFVKHMSPDKEVNKARIKKFEVLIQKKFSAMGWLEKKINANIGILSKGRVVQVYKGTPDEVNNSLSETYALHKQCHRAEIRGTYDRAGSGNRYAQLKLKRCGRFIISFFSREPDLRTMIKAAMVGDFKMRLDMLSKIDFTRYTGFPGKKDARDDIYKVLAFQLAQTILLMRGTEVYSKEEILEHYPELDRLINRKMLMPLDMFILNSMLKELIQIGSTEIELMSDTREVL